MLLESRTIIGKVVAVDSTHLKAYSGRAMDNRTGRSNPDARVGRGRRRGFVLGYASTAYCADSELPIARGGALQQKHERTLRAAAGADTPSGVKFREVLADAQYSSVNVRDAAEWLGAEPVVP